MGRGEGVRQGGWGGGESEERGWGGGREGVSCFLSV